MKSKRTHKLVAMGDAGAVVSASSSIADAARKLGVQRSTVHRWVQSGKVPAPRGEGFKPPASLDVSQPDGNPDEWAATVEAEHALSRTDRKLLVLAVDAFKLAQDGEAGPMTRLAAMGRYQSLVKALHLEDSGKRATAPEPQRTALPTRRVTHDPRRMLQAVK